jgi:hypothetical protein
MISGNGVPPASDRDEGARVRDDRQLRDIQDLIAKLEVVNRQLSFPAKKTPIQRTPVSAETSGAEEPATADMD